MKRLIVPVDFSEESLIAVENAIQLANMVTLHVRMLHVKKQKTYAHLFGGSESNHLPDDVYIGYFEKIIDKVSKKYTVLKGQFDFVMLHGHIVEEIVHFSSESDIYAIFTGLQGTSSLKSYMTGSNAFRLIASSRIPVFTVRKEMGVREINKILLPLDNTHDTRQKIPMVAGLAKEIGAMVKVMALSNTGNQMVNSRLSLYAEQAYDYLHQLGIPAEIEVRKQVNIPEVLLQTAVEQDFDLVAMMNDAIEDQLGLSLGTSVHHILNKSQVPLLLIPRTKRFSTND